jgi:hypothetical protein
LLGDPFLEFIAASPLLPFGVGLTRQHKRQSPRLRSPARLKRYGEALRTK